jgi:hypothetical protein
MGTLLQLMDWIMEAAKTQWLGERPAENQRRECLVGKYSATQYGVFREIYSCHRKRRSSPGLDDIRGSKRR